MSTSTRKYKNHLYSDVEKVRDSLIETGIDLKHLLGDTYTQGIENVKETSVTYKKNTANYIAKHPFQTIGMSLLSGFIIGYWLKNSK